MPSRPRRRRSGDGSARGGDPKAPGSSPVVRALLQRGLTVSACAGEDRTFLPYLSSRADRETLYELLHSYSFRLFLRDILALRDRYRPERLGPFFSPDSVEGMARQVERLGLIRRVSGGKIRFLAESVTDFGDTFEWFVAETLRRQFAADVLWGVTIPDLPCGGDFDILALVSGKLLYLEAKTSPPKHIEQKEMSAMLERVRTLSPDFAIVLVDTHLRMKDKLVPLLSEGLRGEGMADYEMVRVEKETFSWEKRIYLTNAKRDIVSNLSLCLRNYFLGRFFG
ncbi:MAG: hypothetical protein OEM42_04285 [Deltaproteobacteria bacterium]|nr:hypothetical protein [Deltaproteobacteria bacterium]